MTLSAESLKRLQGVHPDLVKVVRRAAEITTQPFIVTEGVRTVERERGLIAAGFSKLTSPFSCRHVPTNGFSHAVDLAPIIGGKVPWKDWSAFAAVARAMKAAASELHVVIEWGGDWKTIKDGPHFQLPRRLYP